MRLLLLTAATLTATTAFAHDGVKDPQVMARMQVMSDIGAATKVLGDMAKGKTEFDPAAAAAAKAKLSEAAANVVPAFTPQASDPKSESKPTIWTQFDDFSVKADALVQAAAAVETGELSAVRQGLGQIGQTCKSCHSDYRQK